MIELKNELNLTEKEEASIDTIQDKMTTDEQLTIEENKNLEQLLIQYIEYIETQSEDYDWDEFSVTTSPKTKKLNSAKIK